MDTKYFINADSNGIIRKVGIKTDKGLKIVTIENTNDPIKYIDELENINNTYGGDFFTSRRDGIAKLVSNRVLEKTKKAEDIRVMREFHPATADLTKKVMSKKAIAALTALAIIVGGTRIAKAKDFDFKDAMKQLGSKATAAFTLNALNKDEKVATTDTADLENKSVDELINMLETVEQRQAFTKIVKTQDYFNETAAPTVRQGDKQLFFTFDETTAAYLYANAKALSSEKLANVFGKSKIMLFNEETGEYETMDKDTVAAKYLTFNLNLSYYYQLGATERSGVDQIFENDKEAEFFKNFEALILEYNKTKSPEVAAQIRAELEKIFMSGQVDSLMNKYEGACSIIGTSIVPYLYLNDVISEDMYNSLVEINESITCDDIYNQIGKITSSLKNNGQEGIIEQIAKLQNEKTAKLDRNVDMTNSLDGYGLDDLALDNAVLGSAPGFKKSKTVTKHYRKVTKSRAEAVRLAGEKAVREAEQRANKEIDKKNQQAEKDAQDLKDGYNDTYNDAFNGNGDHRKEDGSAAYNEGADKGVDYGKQDREKADQDQKEYNETHPEKREEVVEEEFVPANSSVSTSSVKEEPKKVTSVESHASTETKSAPEPAKTESESEEKVLVRE